MLKEKNKVILIFVGLYLPGFRGGGPTKTIANLIAAIGDKFDFKIITSDRDLGDEKPYDSVNINAWNKIGKADVYYISQGFSLMDLRKLMNSIEYDCIYLNSFFSLHFTVKPLLLRRLNMINDVPILLAPRGEFSKGALRIKTLKKDFFFFLSRLISLYGGLIWHASTSIEKMDIRECLNEKIKMRRINVQVAVQVASDISVQPDDDRFLKNEKTDHLKICFLSRISPMKNLDYALDVLKDVKSNVVFDIFGPKESLEYWEVCANKVNKIPSNITVNYKGEVLSHLVRGVLSEYDLLFVPTRGENFGHVFAEALSVGLPILLSDQTPWRNLASHKAGWDLSLDNPEKFVEVIDNYSKISFESRLEYRSAAKSLYKTICENREVINDNIHIFEYVIDGDIVKKVQP